MPFTKENAREMVFRSGTREEIAARLTAGRKSKAAQREAAELEDLLKNPPPISDKQKLLEAAVWDVMNSGGLRTWLRKLQKQKPALFAQFVSKYVPPPKGQSKELTEEEVLGDCEEELVKWWNSNASLHLGGQSEVSSDVDKSGA